MVRGGSILLNWDTMAADWVDVFTGVEPAVPSFAECSSSDHVIVVNDDERAVLSVELSGNRHADQLLPGFAGSGFLRAVND